MKNSILNIGSILDKAQQRSIFGGFDKDGERKEGNLCSGRGPAKNRCGPGLSCKVTGANIGNCVVSKEADAGI